MDCFQWITLCQSVQSYLLPAFFSALFPTLFISYFKNLIQVPFAKQHVRNLRPVFF